MANVNAIQIKNNSMFCIVKGKNDKRKVVKYMIDTPDKWEKKVVKYKIDTPNKY